MKLFVAAMGASNYTYAEACPSESLSDWIGVHTSLFRYLGGVPKFVVCDNLKAAVTNPDRYDPGINRTYAEMAGHYGTAIIADHRPSAHRRYGKWTPGGLIAAGEKIGPSTAAFFQVVIEARPHPEQGFRTCLGILSLARSYDNARVDAACRRGILIKARSVASIRSILKSGLDRAFLDETSDHQPLRHGNIRGQGYFH